MLNSTDKKTIDVVMNTGFTYTGDSHFKTYLIGKRCLSKLERQGLLEVVEEGEYKRHEATTLLKSNYKLGLYSPTKTS